jgi:predicted GH43/DUF377 family glycosyl hydrolase
VGVAHLDSHFEQDAREFKPINLGTDYAEDPRILYVNGELCLFYNALDTQNVQCRFMQVANLNKKTYDVNYTTALDMNLNLFEKNWSPFEYLDENQKTHLLFEYQMSPRKLLELPNLQVSELKNVTLPKEISYYALPWPKIFGEVRGGSAAIKIGDEYLGFFHSSFAEEKDEKNDVKKEGRSTKKELRWYVMGAYTFEAKPPFRVTSISNYPILFRGIFETPYTNTASFTKKVIFPGGFVIEKQGDKELIHLACGENDAGVKIVTFDKEKLLKSMRRVED